MFDSGVGGLSVLRAIRRLMPHADLIYLADAAWLPYGDRDENSLRQRAVRIAEHLLAAGANTLVVACNTATAAAVAELRGRFASLPIVGVEPGLRPALAASRSGRAGVMATSATLRSSKFGALLEREARGRPVQLQACVGLADAIEHRGPDDPTLAELIERHCRPFREAGVDTVALGCTHYVFVRAAIERALGADVKVIDTADAIAAQVLRVTGSPSITDEPAGIGRCVLQSTGEVDTLRRFASTWLDGDFEVLAEPVPL